MIPAVETTETAITRIIEAAAKADKERHRHAAAYPKETHPETREFILQELNYARGKYSGYVHALMILTGKNDLHFIKGLINEGAQ